jgi:hypothetical protein
MSLLGSVSEKTVFNAGPPANMSPPFFQNSNTRLLDARKCPARSLKSRILKERPFTVCPSSALDAREATDILQFLISHSSTSARARVSSSMH